MKHIKGDALSCYKILKPLAVMKYFLYANKTNHVKYMFMINNEAHNKNENSKTHK